MAVYKRTYRAYNGPLTASWSRFWILARYAWRHIFRSRFMTIFFIVCFFPPIVMLLGLYLNHSDVLLRLLRLPPGKELISNLSVYFRVFLGIQAGFAMLLTAFAGPTLISPDLANNALPLYFCRPFSRREYVFGKFCVIAWLVSLITWIPGLILFLVEAGLSGGSWIWDNLWIAQALFFGGLADAVVLALIGLALSAWVKWKPIAGALVLGLFFLGAGFGAAINAVMRTTNGYLIDVGHMLSTLWASLFRSEDVETSLVSAVLQLVAVCALCLWLLSRKVRAFEVVK